jgi:hypothetical protein
MGKANAAVFPVPVGAEAMMSFLANIKGIVFSCTNVGVV